MKKKATRVKKQRATAADAVLGKGEEILPRSATEKHELTFKWVKAGPEDAPTQEEIDAAALAAVESADWFWLAVLCNTLRLDCEHDFPAPIRKLHPVMAPVLRRLARGCEAMSRKPREEMKLAV